MDEKELRIRADDSDGADTKKEAGLYAARPQGMRKGIRRQETGGRGQGNCWLLSPDPCPLARAGLICRCPFRACRVARPE
jgi:hypothetical protein